MLQACLQHLSPFSCYELRTTCARPFSLRVHVFFLHRRPMRSIFSTHVQKMYNFGRRERTHFSTLAEPRAGRSGRPREAPSTGRWPRGRRRPFRGSPRLVWPLRPSTTGGSGSRFLRLHSVCAGRWSWGGRETKRRCGCRCSLLPHCLNTLAQHRVPAALLAQLRLVRFRFSFRHFSVTHLHRRDDDLLLRFRLRRRDAHRRNEQCGDPHADQESDQPPRQVSHHNSSTRIVHVLRLPQR